MSFQTPITVKTALERVQSHEYVLPAIQREFVWSTKQICRLFDSLMQGFPIGSFLFWKIQPNAQRDFVYYDFIRQYHQLNAPHCPKLDLQPGRPLTAVLDGQQRLTALNIGLRGSHAEKLPRKWLNNLDAYPEKHLYLDLMHRPNEKAEEDDEEPEFAYLFRFLTKAEAAEGQGGFHWFPVGSVLGLDAGPGIFKYVQDAGLAEHEYAFHTLFRLHQVVHLEPSINFYEEEDQDVEKVLKIFIRVNSAGTVLSYSDILLSMATAQWRELDARDAVHRLVDDLNEVGQGFDFSKDLVLKAGLVLSDIPDIRFKVENFKSANTRKLEENWDLISGSLRVAARLLSDFGFSARNLKADSVLIPLAYYVKHRDLGQAYLTGKQDNDDRAAVRLWLIGSLLKSGVWGSALDTLLANLRSAIREKGAAQWPIEAVEIAMARQGKSLKFSEDELEDLVETQYGDKNVFPILSLLYPGVNIRNEFHEDHIFPRSRFTPARLRREGLPDEVSDELRRKANSLPNLQILEGPVNTQKSDYLPMEWARLQYPEEAARNMYLASHDMHDLPGSMLDFGAFYDARRQRLEERLKRLLGLTA